jgi:hypothetical protein
MQKVPALQRFPALAANAIDAATTSSQVVGGAKTAAAGLRVGKFGNEKIFTINGSKAPSPRPKGRFWTNRGGPIRTGARLVR